MMVLSATELRSPPPQRNKLAVIFAFLLVSLFAYFAFALPSITFQPPTLSDNATTGANWVYVNVTSSENLNQSLLEWGNSSGFTNVSMSNLSASMQNWYKNMTGLSDGAYNYTVWAQNTTGGWNQTQRRFVYIDTVPPYSLYACQDLTIAGGNYILVQNVSSAGTCFNILSDNVTLDGAGYTINYSQTTAGYGVNVTNRNNVTIKNLNVVQGNSSVSIAHAIYGSNMVSSTINNNTLRTVGGGAHTFYCIYSCNFNGILNNTITTVGGNAHGIVLENNDKSNNISKNVITVLDYWSKGIYLYLSSDSNLLVNNTVKKTQWYSIAIAIDSSYNNSITGGSYVKDDISSPGADYSVTSAGSTNNFTNTNFTAPRKISFGDTASWFNYNNETGGNTWLKTSVLTADTITRTLVNWDTSLMAWNDTNSSSGIVANYSLTGLQPSKTYSVYNTSAGVQTNPYNLNTDNNGVLPSFTIMLKGNTEVRVFYDSTAPQYSLNTTSSTIAGASINHSLYWTDNFGLSGFIFSFDSGNGTFYNDSWAPFSGNGNWSNVSKVINSTIGATIRWKVYANDSSNNWNTSQTYSYITTVDSIPPTITIQSPLNQAYPYKNFQFNITVNKALANAFISVDGGVNNSMANDTIYHYYNVSVSPLSDGNHNATFYANSTWGYINSSTVYFSVNTSGSVHNLNTGYNFSIIQAAINDATTLNGHTIQADSGTYNENIIVNKSINLRSLSTPNTIINASDSGNYAVNIMANGVNISGFTITASNVSGININGYNTSNISGNNIAGNWNGITLNYSSNNRIENNTIKGNVLLTDSEGFESGFDGWQINAGTSGEYYYNVTNTATYAKQGTYSMNISIPIVGTGYQTICLERNYTIYNYTGKVSIHLSFWMYRPNVNGPGAVGYINDTRKINGSGVPALLFAGPPKIDDVRNEWYYYSTSKVFPESASNNRTFWVCAGASTWSGDDMKGESLIDDVVVEIYGNSGAGVNISYGENNTLNRNLVRNNYGDGLSISFSNKTSIIYNNITSNTGRGIYSLKSAIINISGNYLLSHPTSTALHVYASSNSSVDRNVIKSAYLTGIYMFESDSDAGTNENNIISNNLLDGINSPGAVWGAGIAVDGRYNRVINNSIYNSGESSILISGGAHNLVINNTIYWTPANGINLEYRGHHHNITGNTIYKATYTSIRVKMNAYDIIANNTIINSSAISLQTYHSTSSEFNLIENNILSNCTTGIAAENMLSNTIRNNTFRNCGTALDIQGASAPWLMSRGDRYNTGYLEEFFLPSPWDREISDFPIAGEELFWTFDTNNTMKSTPAVVNSVVYIVANGTLYAVEETTGSMLWRYQTNDSYPSNISSIGTILFHSSPAISGDNIFFGVNRTMYAVNITNGMFLWKYTTGGTVVSSPIYYNNTIYFGSEDGYLYELNFSGNQIMNLSAGNPIPSTPIITLDNKTIIKTWNGTTSAYYSNGTLAWSIQLESGGWSSPVFVAGTNYVIAGTNVSSVSGKSSLYAINNSDGTVVWRNNYTSDIVTTPSTESDYNGITLALYNGTVYNLDSGGGGGTSFYVGASLISSAIRTPAHTFIVTQNGTVHRRWEYLYQNNNWNYTIPSNISASVVVAYGKIFVAAENGKLYVFGTPRNITFSGNTISNSTNGLSAYGSSLYLSGNTFAGNIQSIIYSYGMYDHSGSGLAEGNTLNSGRDLTLGGHSVMNLLNTTFNKSAVNFTDNFSTLTVKWYANITIVNSTNSLIGNAGITVKNVYGTALLSAQTDTSGQLITNVTEYVQSAAGNITYTPHNISASKTSYVDNSTVVIINSSKDVTIRLHAVSSDATPPVITIALPQNTTYASVNRTLNYTVTDNVAVSSCWYNYNGTNTTLSGCANATFTAINNTQSTLILYANDTSGNVNSANVTFTLTISCTESWSYSDWSSCSSSVQTRTATDVNSCGTTVNRSALSQSCTSGTTTSSGGGGGGTTTTKTITVTPNEPLTKVVVYLKAELSGPSLAVAKVETVPVSPQEPVYQYINITKANFNNTQIENATIDFKVNKSWISENNFTRIWLAHYDNGWTKLRTDLINSTVTVNYYRAYTDAFSYFAIIGEKAAQTTPPAVEQVKEPVKNETTAVSKEPEKPVTAEEPKKPYVTYVIVVIVLVFAAYAAKWLMGKKLVKPIALPKKQEIKEISVELQNNPPKSKKARPKGDDLDDIQNRLRK